jgi:ADP-ribose pyrophosphatase
MTSFVAEADLPGEGGLHGLASEHEDIRTMVLDFNAALQAVTDGAVNTGPALTSLLWLAVHREALRRDWLG